MERIVGLYHRVDNAYGYQKADNSFIAILRVANALKITNVKLIYDDPYAWAKNPVTGVNEWSGALSSQFFKSQTDGLYTYYHFRLASREGRFKYLFSFTHEGKTKLYGEVGVFDQTELTKVEMHKAAFTWNYSSVGKLLDVPLWWKETTWYQIFPDRFANTKQLKPLPEAKMQHEQLAGGTLQGIIAKLDYIKKLGFGGIYLNPIFKATSNHKYDTIDYFQIDPSFGTNQDFDDLVAKCKKLNLKIMLDGVFNHTGYEHPFWQDVLNKKNKSEYQDYYVIWDINKVGPPQSFRNTDFHLSGPSKQFGTFANTPTMPRLNWANPKVMAYLSSIIEFWTNKGIDAWRMDVADEVSFACWRVLRNVAKAINPAIVLLGEIWYDSYLFLQGDQFDSTMNYPFGRYVLNYFVEDKSDVQTFVNLLIASQYHYSENLNQGLFNLLGSHDTPRLARLAKFNYKHSRLALAFLLLYPGSPSIYYGDEFDYVGLDDHTNREVFNWDYDAKHKTYLLIKSLLAFRQTHIKVLMQMPSIKVEQQTIILSWDKLIVAKFDKSGGLITLNKIVYDIN